MKPEGSYHHPGLERALVDAAIHTIREYGIDALTLRDIGSQLGVSRTAIYRHFEDKSALLARVALEGFRIFRQALRSAVEEARARGNDPIEEMGSGYIRFALANKSHYETMFSGAFGSWERYPDLETEARAAFEVLLGAIREEQAAFRISASHDSIQLAHIIWASTHGIATLGMSGHLGTDDGLSEKLEELSRIQYRILLAGLKNLSQQGDTALSLHGPLPEQQSDNGVKG
jgi:AcrR family transcriptional regulator